MAAFQKDDPEIRAYRRAISGLQLEDISFGAQGGTLLCDVSTGHPRPVVPAGWRCKVFDHIHDLSNPSMRATRKLMVIKFIWHGLQKQVGIWVKACIPCQTSMVQWHIKAPLQTFRVPQHSFNHINVDLIGPLPPSTGYTHLLTIVDCFTRWAEAIPLSDTSAFACAQALITHWIARFGMPMDMSSDRGSQFTSYLWDSISQLLGMKLHHTIAYHLQSNGLVERFHCHLKSALRACLKGPNWLGELSWVLLQIRAAPKEDLRCSSAEFVYGAPLTVSGNFIANQSHQEDHGFQLQCLHDHVRSLVPAPTSKHGAVH